jgi:hypothetical protein
LWKKKAEDFRHRSGVRLEVAAGDGNFFEEGFLGEALFLLDGDAADLGDAGADLKVFLVNFGEDGAGENCIAVALENFDKKNEIRGGADVSVLVVLFNDFIDLHVCSNIDGTFLVLGWQLFFYEVGLRKIPVLFQGDCAVVTILIRIWSFLALALFLLFLIIIN